MLRIQRYFTGRESSLTDGHLLTLGQHRHDRNIRSPAGIRDWLRAAGYHGIYR